MPFTSLSAAPTLEATLGLHAGLRLTDHSTHVRLETLHHQSTSLRINYGLVTTTTAAAIAAGPARWRYPYALSARTDAAIITLESCGFSAITIDAIAVVGANVIVVAIGEAQ
eukprot:CAMPEP_0171993520 /NCGR_PEP_ID=MMETSP0993-20121228/278487_1 /TAXON_ID=483369 /ORGANISM="non described non described, Strain CCMP2098" /LENGTH=111 /DNA_ID=CAMNT_0012646577 /DNA_START=665 /DNA_END=1002 /DNA_ORIENTATION=+